MAIYIPLTEGYRLTSDPRQYILQQYKGTHKCSKTGELKETWDAISFSSSLPRILRVLQHRCVDQSGATTLKELQQALQSYQELIEVLNDSLYQVRKDN